MFYYITLGKTTWTDILPGSSQKRIGLNQLVLMLPSITLSYELFKIPYLQSDLLHIFTFLLAISFQSLAVADNWPIIFDSPWNIVIMFKSFLITETHFKTIIFSSIFTYFLAIFQNLVVLDNWANIFDSPPVIFIMFELFLMTKIQ